MFVFIRTMSAVLTLFCLVLLVPVYEPSAGLEIYAEPGQNVTVKPGDDFILRCEGPQMNNIIVLEWSRTDLGGKKMFVFRDGRPYPAAQHESFRNRVFLKNNQMKDGDLSVVLKNLKIEDSGIYECRVLQQDDLQTELKLISSIRLMVIPPGEEGQQIADQNEENNDGGPEKTEGMSGGFLAGIIVGVLLVLLVLVVLFWIFKKRNNPRRRSPEPNENQVPLRSPNRDPKPEAWRHQFLKLRT